MIGTLLGLVSGSKTMIFAALGAALLAGVLLWQIRSLQEENAVLAENNGKLEVSLQNQGVAIKTLQIGLKFTLESTQDLANEMAALDEESQKTKHKLNAFRGRLEDVAIAKPGLVGDRATRAFGRVLHDFNEATGYTDDPD